MTKFKTINLSVLLMLLLAMSLFVSCGSDDDGRERPFEEEIPENQDEQGTYEAVLNPINASIAGVSQGRARIRIRGDLVKTDIDVMGAPRFAIHRQFIFTGSTCPVAANDINLDGIIDYQEGRASAGNILIPLDNELNSQLSGTIYPLGSRYFYDESASLSRLLSDLFAPDPFPQDDTVKLAPGERLNLAGRAVMIHGVRPGTFLPTTASGSATHSPQSALPIACGVFVRVADNEEPGPIPTPTPPRPRPPVELCPVKTSFSTRLSSTLLIEGVRCLGGETTEVIRDDGTIGQFVCQRGQWLLQVDNINTCTPDGGCTEIGVPAIVTELRRAGVSNPPVQCTYDFRPISPSSTDQRQDMNEHQVRFYNNRMPQVIPK